MKFLKRRRPKEKGKNFGVPGNRFESAKQDTKVEPERPPEFRGATKRRKPKIQL